MPDVIAKHDADLAGGAKEEVFSSDGAGTVDPIAFPVKEATGDAANDEDDAVDGSHRMSAEQAFEVFAGKVFQPNPYAGGDPKASSSSAESTESPLERLGRLQREVRELVEETTNTSTGTNTNTEDDSSSVLREPIAQLHADLQRASVALSVQQDTLTGSIQASVNGLTEGSGSSTSAKDATTTASSSPSSSQLFLERLQQLEHAVNTTTTVADRLTVLEQLPALKVDQLQKQAKVIRQDLEAAAKARHKLGAASGSGSSMDDSKTIAALYDQVQSLQGLSQHLPALVQRLQALAGTHAHAATVQSRLAAVEQHVNVNLSAQTASVETAVTTLEGVLQENAAAMQANMAELEGRMKAMAA